MINLQEIETNLDDFTIIHPADPPPRLTPGLIQGLWQKTIAQIMAGKDVATFTEKIEYGTIEHWYYRKEEYTVSISVNHDYNLVQMTVGMKTEMPREYVTFRLKNGLLLIWMAEMDFTAVKIAFALATMSEKLLALLNSGVCLALYRDDDLTALKAEISANDKLQIAKYDKIPTVRFVMAKSEVTTTSTFLKEKVKRLTEARIIPDNPNLLLAEDFLNRLAQN